MQFDLEAERPPVQVVPEHDDSEDSEDEPVLEETCQFKFNCMGVFNTPRDQK